MSQKTHQKDQCEVYTYDQAKVNRVKRSLTEMDTQKIAQLFKALSEPSRLKVVYALVQEEEVCVCDIANILGTSMANASHHLRLLRNMGLAKQRKVGKLVFYSLVDDRLSDLVRLVWQPAKELQMDDHLNQG